jgi:hypothetical protein
LILFDAKRTTTALANKQCVSLKPASGPSFAAGFRNGSRESTIQARWIEFFVDGLEASEWLRPDKKALRR